MRDQLMSYLATSDRTPKSSSGGWLFSPAIDLLAFGGSTVLSLLLLALGMKWGLLRQETPEWTWVVAILFVDVAHVWATGFRVYFVPAELKQRPWLYFLTPFLSWLIGVCVYWESEAWFWRCLAYLAVFHFVRQQAGWVLLYRARSGDAARFGRWIDLAAIYTATLWPLLWWHGHLPRSFWWFRTNDFATISSLASSLTEPLYWLSLFAYCAKSIHQGCVHSQWRPGKDLVVASTAICWYLGIVYFNSDFAFTVTNVLIHGIPYIVLVHWYRRRWTKELTAARPAWRDWSVYLATIWVLAYTEELLWDRGVWHERSWLFGDGWNASQVLLVPLLAVPQLTHYILDGFLWKRRFMEQSCLPSLPLQS